MTLEKWQPLVPTGDGRGAGGGQRVHTSQNLSKSQMVDERGSEPSVMA